MMDFNALRAPFNPADINWRVGATSKDQSKGIALAYLDARNVMARLNEVCGPENWQCEYPFPGCCRIGIYCPATQNRPEQWVWKANCAGETKVEGEKGQASDAFKRAAVLWGIGEYLYHLPNSWFPLDQYKRFSKETTLQITKRFANWQQQYLNKEA